VSLQKKAFDSSHFSFSQATLRRYVSYRSHCFVTGKTKQPVANEVDIASFERTVVTV